MSWIDWSPKSSLSGSCQTIGITVSTLGSCDCIQLFGQPYPSTREIDYMQAVSVPGGGIARWTLSAAYLAK